MLDLPDLQREFFRAIAPARVARTTGSSTSVVIAEIRDDGGLRAPERLDIYARMYAARLVDALTEDYPRVLALVGWERFHELAHAYLAEHPSRHPSLRWFGERFAGFLASTVVVRDLGFLADLARLEWARVMVFDAPDVELLPIDSLRRHPPESWATLRLRTVPALQVLRVAWPVHEIWDAAGAGEAAVWCPADRVLRVWRQGDGVFQAPMDLAERVGLARVQAGDDFGSVCEGLGSVMSAGEVAEAAGSLVLRWLEDELLCADDPRS